jgi:hypothetical protein
MAVVFFGLHPTDETDGSVSVEANPDIVSRSMEGVEDAVLKGSRPFSALVEILLYLR